MLEPQTRTPFGGMNQDDSLITPSADAAGKNMFEAGDYRYALNARIGSSRSDHFGDLENIKDTVEVTGYYVASDAFENSSFDGSLDGWAQLDESVDFIPWTYNSNAARLTLTPDIGIASAPAYVSKSSWVSQNGNNSTESINVAYPTGLQAGDLIILVAINSHPGVGTVASIVSLGWTGTDTDNWFNIGSVSSGHLAVYYKIATGSESGTVNVDGFCDASFLLRGVMYNFRSPSGAPVVEFDDSTQNRSTAGEATITFSAVTVSGIHRTLIAIAVGDISASPAPTGYTMNADDSDANNANIVLFSRVDVSSDGAVTKTGGGFDGWAADHLSFFAEGYVATDFESEVLYQNFADEIGDQVIVLQFSINASAPIDDCIIHIVFLDGSTIISEQQVHIRTITTLVFNQSVTAPANTDGIGIRIFGSIDAPTTLDLEYFRAIGTFLSPGTRPTGNEKVIGKYEDYEFQRLYYCVWNDEDNHCIRYWDALNNYVVEVLQWPGLNWLSTTFVKMAKLDNWMAFTDRRNPPRLIDVDTVSALKIQLGDEFREFHISFHKWAPTAPAIPRAFYDGVTNNYEKLKDKVYHFAYRYVYNGNLRSRWSPISKGATVIFMQQSFYTSRTITSIEVDIPGCILNDPTDTATEYNYFDHNDIKFTAVVKSIELAFQDGDLELWKLWKRVPIDPSFNRLQYFDGNGILTPLSQEDFNQPFDTVPFLAGTVEAIDNRFVFADCLDEKPPVTYFEVENLSSDYGLSEWQDAQTASFATISAIPRAKLQRLNTLSKLTFKDRCLYKFGLQFLYPTGWRTAVYTSEDWLYNIPDTGGQQGETENLALNFSIPALFIPPEGAVGYQVMRTNALNISYYMFGIINKFTPIIDDVSAVLDQLELPESVKTRISQHFLNVQTTTGQDIIAETQRVLNEEIEASAKKDKKIKRRNKLLRANRLFEASWSGTQSHSVILERWGRKNPIGPVLQQELRKTKALGLSLVAEASRIFIDINNWVFGAKKDTDEEFPLNKLFYDYTPGDRVRFVGSDVATPDAADLKEYDVPIIEFTGKGIIIERPESLLWLSDPTVLEPRNFNIEVYTPKVSTLEDHTFYEMGEWYPILFPGQSNRDFSKRDFVWTDQASVTLSQYGPFDIFNKMPLFYGDSYKVGKTAYRDDIGTGVYVGASSAPIWLSMNPDENKTFDYWDKNNGRPSISYEELPVVRFKPTQARFGGKIVEESFVNNLNNMRDEDQFVYPSEYGRIRDLVNTSNAQVESVGAILLAIGERESWSIYVNRTTLEDLSGRSQVSVSDQVLGSFNTLLGSHGTFNPESICKARGRVYWWNALDGSWVRYGRDGITEISEYKMSTWFNELGELLITKYQTIELPMAIAEFDGFNKELVTYQNHSTLPATFRGYSSYKGAQFNETDTRWKSIHTMSPEMFGKMNNQFVSFIAGSVLLHERGPAYGSYNGVKYNVQWEPVFNDSPSLKKAWKALGIVATNRWSVERVLSEYRGMKNKQQTRIPIGKFVEKEDNFYCELPRNLNTPNIANPVIEGDLMRSKAIQVLMQLDPDVDYLSLLHYVNVELADSPKNP